MKTLLTITGLGFALAIAPAIAAPQTSPDSPATEAQPSPGAAMPSAPDAPSAPGAGTPAAAPETPGGSAASGTKPDKQQSSFMTSQSPDDRLVSSLIGQTVYNANNETIGKIGDLLTSRDGRIVAAIIEFGSFLGLGGKQVAVSFDTLQFSNDENGSVRVSLNVAQQRLNSAPEFKTLEQQQGGTGAGSGQ